MKKKIHNSALDELRRRYLFRLKNLNVPLRIIAGECGVSASCLSRFANGANIDADSALKIGFWLNIGGDEVFGRCGATDSGDQNPLECIKKLILSDESIEESRREDLCGWFEQTYGTFAKTDGKTRI